MRSSGDFRTLFQASQAGITATADTPGGTLQVPHSVIWFCSDYVFCLQHIKALALVFWQKLMRLEFFNWYMETNLLTLRNTDSPRSSGSHNLRRSDDCGLTLEKVDIFVGVRNQGRVLFSWICSCCIQSNSHSHIVDPHTPGSGHRIRPVESALTLQTERSAQKAEFHCLLQTETRVSALSLQNEGLHRDYRFPAHSLTASPSLPLLIQLFPLLLCLSLLLFCNLGHFVPHGSHKASLVLHFSAASPSTKKGSISECRCIQPNRCSGGQFSCRR